MKRSQQQPKPLPFHEAQIQERAYQLWQERGEGTSSDENWQAAIEALKRERSAIWRMRQWLLYPLSMVTWLDRLSDRFLLSLWRFPGHIVNFLRPPLTKIEEVIRLASVVETPSAALDLVKVVISGFGVLATVLAGVGLYLTYRNSQVQLESAHQDRQLNTERLVTDRFAKAAEQLGNRDIDVRLGGIYSLERIAKDSPKDHWMVMEVLTAYVRNKSPLPRKWVETDPKKRKPLPEVATDVQAALTVIGRRVAENDIQGELLDLSYSNLSNAKLYRANLSSFNLKSAYLKDASLGEANLNRAYLEGARLIGAYLKDAYLESAYLEGANLYGAYLEGANLKYAYLHNADLRNVVLYGAVLSGANLSFASLIRANLRKTNLSGADLKRADLNMTNLSGADLRRADLNMTFFVEADLRGADLRGADLSRSHLPNTNLSFAKLGGATIRGADLRKADLSFAEGVTPNQVKRAQYWQKAYYDNAFRQQLGLPPEKP